MDRVARLQDLRRRDYNYDPSRVDERHWRVDDRVVELPAEAPGAPAPDGSFAVARRLMRSYQFADPAYVEAFDDPDSPLDGRTMLLEMRVFRVFRAHAGVRVVHVYEDERDGTRMWGWAYRTLQGHVEMGEMDWSVRKDLATGAVRFHVHSYSVPAADRNVVVRLGFRLYGRRLHGRFLDATCRRMQRLTALALREGLDRALDEMGHQLATGA